MARIMPSIPPPRGLDADQLRVAAEQRKCCVIGDFRLLEIDHRLEKPEVQTQLAQVGT
jgi:hypothetical protein